MDASNNENCQTDIFKKTNEFIAGLLLHFLEIFTPYTPFFTPYNFYSLFNNDPLPDYENCKEHLPTI